MRTIEHVVPNGAGWHLSAFQTWQPSRLQPSRNPVLIVPGYGMNSHIFSYHPRGVSLEGFLADHGFEVWRADLRAQGRSVRVPGGKDRFGIEDLAMSDFASILRAVLERTRTGATHVDVIGASLGGTILLSHAVLAPSAPLGAMVVIGTPVRWVSVHPLIRLAFSSPQLAGLVRFRNTRRLAELVLTRFAHRTKWVLSIYMNPEIIDTTAAHELVRTVEDPNRYINQEIAHWIRRRDLVLRGVNVAEGLRGITNPLLCILANGDGIVPPATAEFTYRQAASRDKRLITVGTDEIAMAHADMFVSNLAHERVFTPVAEWLAEQNEKGTNKSPRAA